MRAVFADTVYFLALLNTRDQLHYAALTLSEQPPGPLITTEWVLIELGDALAMPPARGRFTRLLASLRELAEIIPASHDLFERGCALFAERKDKSWSLTDCLSFVVMQQQGIEAALTADQHFEQAGFRRLMRA